MLTEIRIYYEGDALLKPGFHRFFSGLRQRAKDKRCGFRLIPSRGTQCCRDFAIAIRANPNAWCILLKDSEGPDSGNLSVSLCNQNGWNPSQADSIFWMVEMMESWFHADKDAIESFYGAGFNRNALKANPKVEQIPKKDLEDGLRAATKNTGKGDYFDNKTLHGQKLLELIDPSLVQRAAPNCRKLFRAVLARLA